MGSMLCKTIAQGAATVAGEAKAAVEALAPIAKTGNVADLVQTAETYIVFECGSATLNV